MDSIILLLLIYLIPCSIVLFIANYIFDKYFKVSIFPKKYSTEDGIITQNHNFMIKIYFENEKELQIGYNDLKNIYNCEVDK